MHVQMNLHNDMVVIVNSTRHDYKNVTLNVRYFDLTGKEYYSKSQKYNVPANGKLDCFIPELDANDVQKYTLARLELRDSKGKVLSINDYLKNWGNLQSNKALNGLGKPKLTLTTKKATGKSVYELSNNSNEFAVAVKLNAKDKATGEIILPAYFSDGYINLLPGEKRTIELTIPEGVSNNFNIIAEGYNLDSVVLL